MTFIKNKELISVLYIVSTLKRTGPINILFNLISKLDRNKYEPKILTLSPEEQNSISLWAEFEKINVKIYSLNLSRLKGILIGKSVIKKFIVNHQINVIHLFGFRCDLLVRKSNYKEHIIISTINSNIYEDYTMLYGKIKGTLMAYLHIKSLAGKNAIGCSSSVSNQLNKRYGINLKVILNGIPKEYYNIVKEEEKLSLKNELKVPKEKKIFIFVGYLIYRKDPLTVLRGFLKSARNEDSYLIMIGDGPLMGECKDIAKNKNNILFLGNQPETLKFLKISDYYIASAYSEGLPTSVMEAMGCGLPVILSQIDPHIELIKEISNWAYTFPVNDNEALANKINQILEEPYELLAKKCRNVIENEINSSIMARNYQNLYIKN